MCQPDTDSSTTTSLTTTTRPTPYGHRFVTPGFSNRLEFDRKPRYDNYLPLGQPKVMPVLPKPADKSLQRGTDRYHVGMTEESESLHLVLLTRVVRTAAPFCNFAGANGELLLCRCFPVSVHPACVTLTHIPSGDYRCQDGDSALGSGIPATTETCTKSHTCSFTGPVTQARPTGHHHDD